MGAAHADGAAVDRGGLVVAGLRAGQAVHGFAPIIEKTGAQLEGIRGDTGKRVRDTIVEAHREISQYLTPEQQERLKQMEQRQRRWMHREQWHRNATPPAENSPAQLGPVL